MYDKTVTLFNRHSSRQGVTWYPTVLTGVDFNIDKASIMAKYGAESSDSAALHVRYTKREGDIYVQGKKWLPPLEWGKQGDTRMKETITFADGNDFDFLFWGVWTESPVSDDDYAAGLYDYMNKSYDYVFAISSVGGPYALIPHFEILGK